MPDANIIAVVGAGLVGSGWALVFAQAGYKVQVFDPSEEVLGRVLDWAQESLEALERVGLVSDVQGALGNIAITRTLADALDGAGYVQESVFETLASKTAVSLEIDALMDPRAIVGSSSSGIPASRFTERCINRGRFLIAHPVNPPHLVPVVELVPAPWTDDTAMSASRRLMEAVGQIPVSMTREIDGFILNRLQGALLNEAWALYGEGYASLKDIDATVSHGLGLRWAFMGPFETIDLNAPGGIKDYANRLGDMYFQMAKSRAPAPWSPDVIDRAEHERRQALATDQLASRRTWRDGNLTRLAAFKKENGLT